MVRPAGEGEDVLSAWSMALDLGRFLPKSVNHADRRKFLKRLVCAFDDDGPWCRRFQSAGEERASKASVCAGARRDDS